MTTVSSRAVSSLSFCLLVLLLPASHGASSHASYRLGARQVFFKTPGRPQQDSMVPPATTCSSLTTGLGNNKLPVVHRKSPCSPLQGLQTLTVVDILRRDASLIRNRFSSQSSLVAAVGSSSAPAATIIPVNGSSSLGMLRGTLDYSVLVSFGTPKQQFPMFLRIEKIIPASVLRCKPCAKGSDDCDPAFDTSRSSTFTRVLCGSPDCPTNNCTGGSYCSLSGDYSVNTTFAGTFAEDVLTLAPSMAIHNFRFFCMDVDEPFDYLVEAGSLNLGKGRNSLPSQLYSSRMAPTTTFSYCLPRSPSSLGFLSLGNDDYNVTTQAPLVSSVDPELENLYFIDVVGMSLGGEDLPIPAGTFGNNDTILDVDMTFTFLTLSAYTPLRDLFRKQMLQYNNLTWQGFDELFDTCFNFTGLQELKIPLIEFQFSNGESLVIDREQMMYYPDPDAASFTMVCLAFSSLEAGVAISGVIGIYTLASTEVVYDVAGGKVGFNPSSC